MKLLLHSCCAPCSSSVFDTLTGLGYNKDSLSAYFYNPNVLPSAEYNRRLDEMRRLCDLSNISLLVGDYDCDNYITAVSAVPEPDNYEGNGKNSGKRCAVCFRLRLSQTAKYAASNGYDAICTTLTVSPHKCSADINRILAEVAEMYGVTPLICDFKKKDGYLKSLKLSEKYALYRQDYCGCGITTKKILPILQNEIGNIK